MLSANSVRSIACTIITFHAINGTFKVVWIQIGTFAILSLYSALPSLQEKGSDSYKLASVRPDVLKDSSFLVNYFIHSPYQ